MERDIKYGRKLPAEINAEELYGKPVPYPYGFFPYVRERLKGTKGISLYGFEDGLWNALFADWGDESALSRN